MLSPTLPGPGAALPGGGDTHQLQHPPAGTACADQPLGTSGSFLTGKWFPTEIELGARAPGKKTSGRLSGTVSPFRAEQGTSPETPSRARASFVLVPIHVTSLALKEPKAALG